MEAADCCTDNGLEADCPAVITRFKNTMLQHSRFSATTPRINAANRHILGPPLKPRAPRPLCYAAISRAPLSTLSPHRGVHSSGSPVFLPNHRHQPLEYYYLDLSDREIYQIVLHLQLAVQIWPFYILPAGSRHTHRPNLYPSRNYYQTVRM